MTSTSENQALSSKSKGTIHLLSRKLATLGGQHANATNFVTLNQKAFMRAVVLNNRSSRNFGEKLTA
jgi:hypothetical protein